METLFNEKEKLTRELFLDGEDTDIHRRGDKTVVAKSECRFTCQNSLILSKCLEAIRASDEHLRKRPVELIMWDWKSTWVERLPTSENGAVVILGVAWYDIDFFNEKRDTYLNMQHILTFENIGLKDSDIEIVHWIKYS